MISIFMTAPKFAGRFQWGL